jgi:TonB-linked SusC/RagA family outer membrane protein
MTNLSFFFRNHKRFLGVSLVFFILILGESNLILAQTNRQIAGIVISSEDNEPIIGASIVATGTQIGTVTDINGKFILSNIPSNVSSLMVSFLGFKTQTVSVRSGEQVRIVLESEVALLDEIIVVAYGTSTKQSFTGSASVIKSDAINKIQSPSVTNSLEGRTAGVQITSSTGQPGENPRVRIRGVGSINAGKDPLYIVDGATYDSPISTLNSADVESITVLKDAAANSLYGARGANGVILITTKRGSSNKQIVTLDAKWGTNSRAIPEYDLITNRATYYEQTWKGQFNKLYDNYTSRETNKLSAAEATAQAKEDIAGNGANSLSKILGGYNSYNVPWANLIDENGRLSSNAQLLYTDDWSDALFRNSLRQEYNVGISGGDTRQSYYVGLGYLNDKSYAKASGFDRYSGRIRFDKELTKHLKGGVNLSYAHTIQDFPTTSGGSYVNYFQWVRQIGPIYPVFLRDPKTGDIVKDKNGKNIYDYGDSAEYGYSRPYGANINPAGVLDNNIDKNTSDNIVGAIFLEAQLYKGLSVKGTFDVNTTLRNNVSLTTPLYGDAKSANGYVQQERERFFSYTGSVFLTYKKNFEKLGIDFIGGTENYQKEYSYLYGFKSNLAVSDEPEFNNAVIFRELSSFTQKYSVTGYLTRLNLTYDDKYYLSASLRRDGSSRFHPDNRWGNFGSVGASWRISKESFLENATFITDLKVKGSIGSQGNDNLLYSGGSINYIPYLDHYDVSNNNDNVSVKQVYVGNKDISWEKSLNANVGIEAQLFDRWNVNVEYFIKKTSDMLFYKPLALSTGVASIPVNLGGIRNTGIEFETDIDIIRNHSFTWNIGLNSSYIKNTILTLPEENREKGIYSSGYTKLVEGGSIYDIYLPDFAGVNENGKNTWYIYNEDGSVKEATTTYTNAYTDVSRRKQGSAIPDLSGGFSTNFTYKRFDLSAVFSYQLGGKVYDAVYAATMQMNETGRGMHADLLKAWTPENTNTTVPRLVLNYVDANRASNLYLTDASYLNIRNISIGYTIPQSALKALGKVRIYAIGDNLALFSKRKGLDPRQYDYGTSGYNYSPLRTVSFGFNVTL